MHGAVKVDREDSEGEDIGVEKEERKEDRKKETKLTSSKLAKA